MFIWFIGFKIIVIMIILGGSSSSACSCGALAEGPPSWGWCSTTWSASPCAMRRCRSRVRTCSSWAASAFRCVCCRPGCCRLSSPSANATGTVTERIALVAAVVTSQQSKQVTIKFLQKDFCTLLGTQRATLIHALETLQSEGIIDYDANQIKIINLQALRQKL